MSLSWTQGRGTASTPARSAEGEEFQRPAAHLKCLAVWDPNYRYPTRRLLFPRPSTVPNARYKKISNLSSWNISIIQTVVALIIPSHAITLYPVVKHREHNFCFFHSFFHSLSLFLFFFFFLLSLYCSCCTTDNTTRVGTSTLIWSAFWREGRGDLRGGTRERVGARRLRRGDEIRIPAQIFRACAWKISNQLSPRRYPRI